MHATFMKKTKVVGKVWHDRVESVATVEIAAVVILTLEATQNPNALLGHINSLVDGLLGQIPPTIEDVSSMSGDGIDAPIGSVTCVARLHASELWPQPSENLRKTLALRFLECLENDSEKLAKCAKITRKFVAFE